MATMKITWSSLRRPHRVLAFSLVFTLATLSSSTYSHASRSGTLAPNTSFSVGYTFELAGAQQFCSGSLIAPTIIVTAAHCVTDQFGNKSTNYIFAAPGTALDAPIDPSLKLPKVIDVITRPGYVLTAANDADDIAFLKLDIPLAQKGYIRVATEQEVRNLTDQQNLIGYGFGYVYEENTPYSVYTRSYPINWKLPSTKSSSIEITSTSATPCKGDSGGPVTVKLSSGEEVLVGIISGAALVIENCGTAKNGIYTMKMTVVNSYLDLVNGDLSAVISSPKPAIAPKIYKVTCVRGKTKKIVRGAKPICPAGFRQTAKVLISK